MEPDLDSRRRVSEPSPAGRVRRFLKAPLIFLGLRWRSAIVAISRADNAEKMRAALAIIFVGILVTLQFRPIDEDNAATASLATAAETLAIAVVAFYFGLHTPATGGSRGAEGSRVPDGREDL